MVIDATGGRLNIIDWHEQNQDVFVAHLPAAHRFGSKYSGFGITNHNDLPKMSVTLQRKGSFFYPTYVEKQLKIAMFKLTDVPLELYENLLAQVKGDNADSLIYIWPGKLRKEINSLLILINLSASDYQQLGQFLHQKIDLNSFLTRHSQDLHLEQRILALFQTIREYDVKNETKIEPPFLYEPYLYVVDEKLPHIFGRPIVRVGDSVFNGHPKVGNGLGSHLVIIKRLHDFILALS